MDPNDYDLLAMLAPAAKVAHRLSQRDDELAQRGGRILEAVLVALAEGETGLLEALHAAVMRSR